MSEEPIVNAETQQSDDSPVSADAGRTFKAEEVNAIVRDRLNRQKAQHDRIAGEIAALRDQYAGEIDTAKKSLEKYETAFKKVLEDKRKGLPEPVLKLLDGLDPLDQLDWLAENATTFAQPVSKPVPPSPRPEAGKPIDAMAHKRVEPMYSL